jgi:Beta-galactosidase
MGGLIAFAWVVLSGILTAQRASEPFVPVGVIYAGEPGAAVERTALELQAISKRGFNTIVIVVGWAEAEPARRDYHFESLARAIELAPAAGLRVILRVDTSPAPDWVLRRYPDGRFVPGAKTAGAAAAKPRACLDHPDVRADALAFVAAATERASRLGGWYALEVISDPAGGFCLCSNTRRRFEEWSKVSGETDRAAFVRVALRDDLSQLAGASSSRGARPVTSHTRVPSVLQPGLAHGPGQDDWLMNVVVDRYGGAIDPSFLNPAGSTPSLAPLALDGLAAAARNKGWWMHVPGSVSRDDARMLGWAALSRGARGLIYSDWREGLEFSPVVTRNPALFLQLRPRPAKIAILYDPRGSDAELLTAAHRALLEQNIPVDFIHHDEVAGGAAAGYRAVVHVSTHDPSEGVVKALQAHVAAGGTSIDAVKDKVTAGKLVELALRAGAVPDVRISGSNGLVETRFLESSNVLMLIALNHADSSQKVTLTFTPDTQEAIWLNMETGTGVNFVAGPGGPTYNYWFRPRDALVLMIRKDVR